jgi:alkyl hydroperoxide reductase subunit AhpF
VATAKTILRDYINATVGFTELAEATHIPSKSLIRMLGPSGNPRAENLLEVVRLLQQSGKSCASIKRLAELIRMMNATFRTDELTPSFCAACPNVVCGQTRP